MKVWIVAATWFMICWIAVFGSRTVPPNSPINNYTVVSFDMDGLIEYTYKSFMDKLLETLSDHVYDGFQVLPIEVPLDSEKSFVLVKLKSHSFNPILALDATNARIVGFSPKTGSEDFYFFKNVSDDVYRSPIFNNAIKHRLPFNATYDGLEEAGVFRNNVTFKYYALRQAVYQLANYQPDTSDSTDTARSLLFAIQMISEAARFKYVREQVVLHMLDGFIPTRLIISLEDNWVALSLAIQKSVDGKLVPPVTLRDDDDKPFSVSTVDEVRLYVILLLGLDDQAVFSPGGCSKMLVSKF